MSKMRRNPVTPPDFDAAPEREYHVDATPMEEALAKDAVTADKPKDLAKVMTNDDTPRCPFCLSPRLEPINSNNPWGRKWVCNACCTAFREPVRGKTA